MAKSNQRGKEKMLPAIIAIALVVLLIMGVLIISPVMWKIEDDNLKGDLATAVADAPEQGDIILTYEGESEVISKEEAGYIYSTIIGYGTGIKTDTEPEGEMMNIAFPDGTTLDFGSVKVEKGKRTGRDGLYICITNKEGKAHKYYTDITDFWRFKNQLMGED